MRMLDKIRKFILIITIGIAIINVIALAFGVQQSQIEIYAATQINFNSPLETELKQEVELQQTEFLNTGNTILGIILGVVIVIIIINIIKFAFYEEPSGGKHDALRKPKRRNIIEKEKAKSRVRGGKH